MHCVFIGDRENTHIFRHRDLQELYLAWRHLLFFLGGVIEHHLDTWVKSEPHAVAELRKSLYVDDLLSGGVTVAETKLLKQKAIEIF